MLHWDEQLEIAKTAKPKAPRASARLDSPSTQLELELPATDGQRIEHKHSEIDDPVIIRRSVKSYQELISKVLDVHREQLRNPYWAWQKFLSGMAGKRYHELEVIWQESLDEQIKTVAVYVAPDQPPQHKDLKGCPTYCLVFKFGPSARGPPSINSF